MISVSSNLKKVNRSRSVCFLGWNSKGKVGRVWFFVLFGIVGIRNTTKGMVEDVRGWFRHRPTLTKAELDEIYSRHSQEVFLRGEQYLGSKEESERVAKRIFARVQKENKRFSSDGELRSYITHTSADEILRRLKELVWINGVLPENSWFTKNPEFLLGEKMSRKRAKNRDR